MSLSSFSCFPFSSETTLTLDGFEHFPSGSFVLAFLIFTNFEIGCTTLWVKCKSPIKPSLSRSDEAPSGRELEVLLFFAASFSSFFFFRFTFSFWGAGDVELVLFFLLFLNEPNRQSFEQLLYKQAKMYSNTF